MTAELFKHPILDETRLFVEFDEMLARYESSFQSAGDIFSNEKLRTAARDVAGAINVLMQMILLTVGQPNECGHLRMPKLED